MAKMHNKDTEEPTMDKPSEKITTLVSEQNLKEKEKAQAKTEKDTET
ncbi:unnamed protein product [Gongylonema pulchrum]|uniref:Thymosin beta n=1 Tax=Gongylonema pulchrum TaxID=637853 RepID=A0A3P7NS47_9BILA|nr:unnamed protein product [Gongylonema pulchrum]